jgi:hypothetical protein
MAVQGLGRLALGLVKPETVIAWHRKGFRLFWTWKVRHGKPGRSPVPIDVRELIRTMSRQNPLWGAPRIRDELPKLGIDIGETSIGKYIVRNRKPPSQTWRTFLDNHVKTKRPLPHSGLAGRRRDPGDHRPPRPAEGETHPADVGGLDNQLLHTTCWGLLKQPDNQKPSSIAGSGALG